LIALLAGNHSKNTEKRAKLSALILNNIKESPAAKVYFLPYERDLFLLGSADETVSEMIGTILADIDGVSPMVGA
jgi:hypothetical protein